MNQRSIIFDDDFDASDSSDIGKTAVEQDNAGSIEKTHLGPNAFFFDPADSGTIIIDPEPDNQSRTILVFSDKDPVAGWIVGVNQVNEGRSFELKAKRNTIGRGSKNDIDIEGDPAISEETAVLGYDPEANEFYLEISFRSTNNVYVNGKSVRGAADLKAYDIIKFGGSLFIFVPLCCDKFSWSSDKSAFEKKD